MPSVFISHGAPTLAREPSPARTFLSGFGQALGRPRAIVVISAHWETDTVQVLANPRPGTVHDFFGFERALYDLRYPAPGASTLASGIAARLAQSGIRCALEEERGFDHGVWIPLSLMYPEADIPVTQLSVCAAQPPLFHWRLGRALAPLRHAGVLIVGSGALTHNLADFRARRRAKAVDGVPDYADAFCTWVAERIAAGDTEALLAWRDVAPHALRAHPSPEHFLPLHVALGAAGVSWEGQRAHHSHAYGVIGMDCYLFRSGAVLTH